mgnify:CR=1 FL=1
MRVFQIRQKFLRAAFLTLGLLLFSSLHAQKVAVKNNLLYDATLTPNLGFEWRMSDHWTGGLSAGYNPFTFSDNKKWKHVLVSPEARYWFCDIFAGDFLAVNAVYSHFNVGNVKFPFGLYPSVKTERRQGDMVAAGASYGHAWLLSPHWNFEFEVGADVGYTWFDRYECAKCGAKLGTDKKAFVMPRLSVNFVYVIK